METKDLNSIGLAYLEMVEKRNIEAKKNHAKTLDKVDPEELEGDHEDRDDKDIDNDGDVDSSDEYLHKKRKAVKKAIKKDDGDNQDKFKAYDGDDKNDQEGTKVSEDANVIWGARQDAGFGDTIKVMAIITGVGGTDLKTARMQPDALGDALRLTRNQNDANRGDMGFQRFD